MRPKHSVILRSKSRPVSPLGEGRAALPRDSLSCEEAKQGSRTIKSYVLRQGRITAAQARACRELFPKYGIPYREQALDLDEAFGRAAPKILEIGFGMGEATAESARANPQHDTLAVDVYPAGVGSLLNLIERGQLRNLKIIQHDAVEVLEHMITAQSLCAIHVFFPDPWPKKRHHKRRLVNRGFVALCGDQIGRAHV